MSSRENSKILHKSESIRSAVLNKRDELDEVMVEIGGCSHYQIRRHILFFLLCIPFACQNLLMVFVGQNPGLCFQKNSTHCVDVKELSKSYSCPITRSHKFYKNTAFSIVTEFHLVCDRGYLEQVSSSAYFVGAIIGSVIIGWIADRFGRKPVLFWCLAIVMLVSGMSAVAKTLWFFIMARFLTGFFMSGFALAVYVIALEMVSPSYRSMSATLLLNYFSAGLMILGLKAYVLQNWRQLQLITTLPYMILFVFYKFIPESLRWLWSTGQYKRANTTIEKIATENKKTECLAHFSNVIAVDAEQTQFCNYLNIFRHKKLLMYTFILCYSSLVSGIAYYGFFLVSNTLSGDIYLDFVLLALMEIPANFLSIFSTGRFGRKKTVVLSTLIASLSSVSLFFITKSNKAGWQYINLGIALFGKLFLAVTIVSGNIWSCELYPTVARTKGLGLLTALRLLGGAISPWLTTFLLRTHPALPFAIMGVSLGLAGLLSLVLQETKCLPTRDTFEDLRSQSDDVMNQTNVTELKVDYIRLSELDRETVL